jgi:outer membrane receptor protein involved in Fe transport
LTVSGQAQAAERQFNLQANPASQSLPDFARQAGVQIIAPGRYLRGVTLPGIEGVYDVREALQKLLAGTNLEIGSDRDDVIVLTTRAKKASAEPNAASAPVIPRPKQALGAQLASPEVGVAEIIVTSSRREEVLSTVPMSISVLSEVDTDAKTIRSIDDVVRNTPGVTLTRGFGNTSTISIRGVNAAGAGTTGVYIDDTPIQTRTLGVSFYNIYPLVFDLDRIEVLRGPQGTLFGAGSVGGTLRFITPTPSLSATSAYARAEASTVEHGSPSYETGVAYGTPLIADKLGVRASAWFQHTGGYIDRVDPVTKALLATNINSSNAAAFKLAAKFAVTDSFTITPSFFYQDLKLKDTGQYWEEYSRPSAGEFHTGITTAQPSRDRFKLSALKLEYKGEDFDVFANTSYFDRTENSIYDYSTLVPAYFIQSSFDARFPHYPAYAMLVDRQTSITNEARIQSADPNSNLKWLFGAFFESSKQTNYEDIVDPEFSALIQTVYGQTVSDRFSVGILPQNRIYNVYDIANDDQYAAFGELAYTIHDQVTLTAGGRFAEMKTQLNNQASGPFNNGSTSVLGSSVDRGFNPKIGISWLPDEDSLYYASASKGFRPGGVNQAIPYVPGICKDDQDRFGGPAPQAYRSDSIWSYETGIKKYFDEKRVYIAASVYYLRWNNIQLGRTACGLNYIDNSGEARSTGFDIDVRLRVTDDLSLGATLAYIDAKYTQAVLAAPSSATGDRAFALRAGDSLVTQPWAATANIRYGFDVYGTPGYIRADYERRSGFNRPAQLNPADSVYNPDTLQPQASDFMTMRAGVTLDAWDLSFFVKNLTDTTTELNRFFDRINVFGADKAFTFQPRTVGLTATTRF